MSQASELYWQYIQLEPDQQRPLRVRSTYPDRRKDPPRFTDEEAAYLMRMDQEEEQRYWDRIDSEIEYLRSNGIV